MSAIAKSEWTLRAKALVILMLAALAVVGNYFSLPLFFGVDFIFGSIAVMLAVVLLGMVPAVVVAVVGGLYTLILWGHPYALVIFSAEALVVGLLYRRGFRNLVLADLAYWVVIGVPLVLLFYRGMLGLDWEASTMIALKQPLNGLFNVLLAGLLLIGGQLSGRALSKWLPGRPRLQDLLFHALLTLTLLAGAAPIIFESHTQRGELEALMARDLQAQAHQVLSRMEESGPDSIKKEQAVSGLLSQPAAMAVLDRDDRVIASQGMLVGLSGGEGRLEELGDGLRIWLPSANMAAMQRWREGQYQVESSLPGSVDGDRLLIEAPAAPLVQTLESQRITLLALLAAILVLAIVVSASLSRWISRPLSLLDKASGRLTAQIAEGMRPSIPDSRVQEYASLGMTLQKMSGTLADSFHELRQVQAELEFQVQERTKELEQTTSRLRGVLAAASEFGIIASDRDGQITLFNTGAEKMLGYAAEELVDQQTPALFHLREEVAARAAELSARYDRPIEGFRAFAEVADREGSETREWTYVRKDGQQIPISLTVTPLVNETGSITGYLGISEDITERKRTQQALQQFKSTLDQTLDCVFMFDADTLRFFYANEGALRQVGYTQKELLGMHAHDIKPEIGEEQFRELAAPLLAGEQASLTFETVHQHKDGHRLPVEIFLQYMTSEEERPRFVAIVRDVSERKAAERALRENEQRYRQTAQQLTLATEVSRLGIWELNLATGWLDWDAGMFRIYGLKEIEFGHAVEDWKQALLPEHLDRAVADIEKGLSSPGIPYESEFSIRRGNGEVRHVRALAQAIPDSEGRPERVLGINEDITERKCAQTALAEQAEHTQAILDHMADGLITIDENGIIQSFNLAATRIFGYEPDEVLDRNVKMLMPSPHREAHDDYLRNYQRTGVARIIGIGREVEGKRKDGSLFPMDLTVSEVTRQGQPMYVGMVRDITERKRIERMKSEFVSTVSHELRTPLTSISGALGLIAGGGMGELPAQAEQMVAIAHKNSKRLTHLINDLLDMEKIAAGKLHFEMEVQPLQPLVEQALESHRTYSADQEVGLSLEPAATDIEVWVDAQRLQQVLANLLSNAVKFSPPGGTVQVALRTMPGKVRVTVADQGSGIPEEFRDRIFEKFAQADSSDTRQKGGTGLGLAITRELVERMGGRVGFDSVPGEGATFWFELPLAEADRSDGARGGMASALSNIPRILVVEDEPDVAEVLANLLTRSGYEVDVAHTGEKALRALADTTYDALSLDLMLPDISGLEVIRRVRQQAHTASLPIFVVSAKMEEGKLAINGDFSGIEWLAKPIDETRMLESINTWLGSSMSGHPHILHVEDDEDLHQVIRRMAGERFNIDLAMSLREARERIRLERFDVVVLDLGLPDGSGWDLLPEIREHQPETRVLILSGADMTEAEAQKVEGVLLKSRVSAHELLKALGSRIHHETPRNEI